MYEYKCKILRVVDGDTVDVDIDIGFGMWMHKEPVRIMGIDTPETRKRDKVEKAFGLASKPVPRTVAQLITGVPRQKSTRAEKIKKASSDEFWEISSSTIKEPLKFLLKRDML